MHSMTKTHALTLPSLIKNSPIYELAKKICSTLKEKGFEAYLVGGTVRDFILLPHKIPHDLDIATSAQVEDIFSISSVKPHTLTPWAKVEGTTVTYPAKD